MYERVNWKSLPSEETPINASNLNKMDEGISVNNASIGDLTALETTEKSNLVGAVNEVYDKSIIRKEYTSQKTVNAGQITYLSIPTSVPTGYSLVGYIIRGNGYVSQVIASVIDSTNTSCVLNLYNPSSGAQTITYRVFGIYARGSVE